MGQSETHLKRILAQAHENCPSSEVSPKRVYATRHDQFDGRFHLFQDRKGETKKKKEIINGRDKWRVAEKQEERRERGHKLL